MTPTVLITSAISLPVKTPALRMTGTGMRAIRPGLPFFLGCAGRKNIVVCDSTGSSVLTSRELSTIRELGVGIEQIAFKQDDALDVGEGEGVC